MLITYNGITVDQLIENIKGTKNEHTKKNI